MKTIENHCVDCGLPCLGDSCRYKKVVVVVCDDCMKAAKYHIDGYDFCAECAELYLDNLWRELSIMDKAELLNAQSDILM